MLDFTQATAELNASDRAIAQEIRGLQAAGDGLAANLIEAYSLAVTGDLTAQDRFLRSYETWRAQNSTRVSPIAAALGHPMPGAPAAPEPAAALFAGPLASTPVPAAAQPAQKAPQAPPAPSTAPSASAPPAASASSAPATSNGRKRTAWSQLDIVALTRFLLVAPVEQHEAAYPVFDGQSGGKYGVDAIRAKAVELGLSPAPAAPATPRELTAEEQSSIGEAILEWIAPPAMDTETRLLRLRYAGSAIREFVKGIDRSATA